MSYILDALKKSDQERQQNNGPTLQSVHRPPVKKAKNNGLKWAVALLFLVLLLAFSFAGWYFFYGSSFNSPSLNNPSEPANGNTVPLTADKVENTPAVVQQTESYRPEYQEVRPAQQMLPVVAFDELPDPVRVAIPALTFSFHVYSDNPERRTIIINKRRVKEGDAITEKLKLEEITQQGVVLNWEQHRFFINVVENW